MAFIPDPEPEEYIAEQSSASAKTPGTVSSTTAPVSAAGKPVQSKVTVPNASVPKVTVPLSVRNFIFVCSGSACND